MSDLGAFQPTVTVRDPNNRELSDDAGGTRIEYSNDNDSKNWDSEDGDSDDSLTCEYDSTWDECDKNQADTRKSRKKKNVYHYWSTGRNRSAALDMQTYRHGYPGLVEPAPCQVVIQHPNLQFYKNELPSEPDNVHIEEFHKDWVGDYRKLERVHTYIQWLFPLQEDGMNFQAYTLTKDEIKAFIADDAARNRLRKSYELMLDFYGIALVNPETGEVERAENWKQRFHNLNRNTHNSLRITRILKCLGTLGFEHYQAPLVRFFLKETLENGELENVKRSALDYFLFSVLDKAQRRELVREAFTMFQKSRGSRKSRGTERFLWCPKRVQKRFLRELRGEKTDRSRDGPGSPSCAARPTSKGTCCEAERKDSKLEDVKVDSSDAEIQAQNSAREENQNKSANILSDKTDNTSDTERDGETEQADTEAAGSAVEAQGSINDKQEAESAVVKDSSVSEFAKDKQGHSHVATGNEPSSEDSKNVQEQANQEVRPAGVPIDPSNMDKAETVDTEKLSTKDDNNAARSLFSSTLVVSNEENQTRVQTDLMLNTVNDIEKDKPDKLQARESNEVSEDLHIRTVKSEGPREDQGSDDSCTPL